MGHALNASLQDVLVRFERMRGRDVLWQPGTDHAGIATQAVVEKQIMQEGSIARRAMGREAFIARIWRWKEDSGDIILQQLRRLGASCDWPAARFTLDDGMSRAVREAFIALYRDGLIYRDKRLVNWDVKLQTAISDLEVVLKETSGHLWHFRYPLADGGGDITIATTRPETMLGDAAVAVHPDDERYRDLIGKKIKLPLTGRIIPIIADDYADPEQGSGAVKITPAHDFNDFEVGRRHGLEMINILEPDGRIIRQGQKLNLPSRYCGLSREKARTLAVQDMEAAGLLVKIEDHHHAVPCGDRSDEVIEPYLTDQWYVDAATLAGPAIEAVESGRMRFVPANWEKTYFEWMRNIQPWCISRQLWWGHRIPVWHGPDGAHFAAHDEADARAQAEKHYGRAESVVQDEDVLDTWFSSALWPFSTLGWPDKTEALERYFPTQILITGFDIIFFWVARMMMMSMRFMEVPPFETVYIHALVRDDKGQKMTKSRGNAVDPIALIDEYGADALRFTLIIMAAQGRDVKLSRSRVAGYRNFATKLWNAARFCAMHDCFNAPDFMPSQAQSALNKWIVSAVVRTQHRITASLEAYRFNEAADAAYHFVWHIFCDWYVELAKPVLSGDDGDDKEGGEKAKAETQAAAAWTLRQTLLLLHPFMPFITEALWEKIAADKDMLIISDWPDFDAALIDEAADEEMNWLVGLISDVRSVRAEMNVPAGAEIAASVVGAGGETKKRLAAHQNLIKRMARLSRIEEADHAPDGAVQIMIGEAALCLNLSGIIDIKAEGQRLKKEISKAENDMAKIDAKLANENFLARAPEEVIAENRARLADFSETRARLAEALKKLSI